MSLKVVLMPQEGFDDISIRINVLIGFDTVLCLFVQERERFRIMHQHRVSCTSLKIEAKKCNISNHYHENLHSRPKTDSLIPTEQCFIAL